MSDALALARRAVELFNRDFSEERLREEWSGVPDDTGALYVAEPVIVPIRAALEGIEYSGPAALEEFRTASRESWTWLRVDIETMRGLDGGRVLVTGTLTGAGRGSGAETTADITWLIEIEDGRIAAARTYPSEQAALEAAVR
jgi:SnoaL-like domain